jgi:RNA polymerase sigma-70 factor (ECF subfamily)
VISADKEYFKEIILRYEEKLLRYAKYLTGEEHSSADCVQEAFIKAYSNLAGFNRKRKFSSWIYRITHNEAVNWLKKNKKGESLDLHLEAESGERIEDSYILKELKKATWDCLEKLPLTYREPLTLFFLQGKSYDEISDILRMPKSTVGVRIRRAKLLMRTICQKVK